MRRSARDRSASAKLTVARRYEPDLEAVVMALQALLRTQDGSAIESTPDPGREAKRRCLSSNPPQT